MSDEELSEEEYTAKLICLAEECPIGGRNTGCPLRAARKMPFGEKLQWVGSLSPQEKEAIYQYHINCPSHKKGCRSYEDHEEREEK